MKVDIDNSSNFKSLLTINRDVALSRNVAGMPEGRDQKSEIRKQRSEIRKSKAQRAESKAQSTSVFANTCLPKKSFSRKASPDKSYIIHQPLTIIHPLQLFLNDYLKPFLIFLIVQLQLFDFLPLFLELHQ
jgi:hypothetical protein